MNVVKAAVCQARLSMPRSKQTNDDPTVSRPANRIFKVSSLMTSKSVYPLSTMSDDDL